MIIYTCEYCGKSFDRKLNLTRHYARKYKCYDRDKITYVEIKNIINDDETQQNTPSITQSTPQTKKDIEQPHTNPIQLNTLLSNSTIEPYIDNKILIELLIKEREQLQKEKDELQQQMLTEKEDFKKKEEKLLKQIEIEKKNVETEKQNKTIETQNNLNIQINAFGCENLEHITDEFKVKCLKQIYKSIPEMVAKIHFNTKYPENHNVKIPNKKLPYASVMTADNVWKTVDKKNTISSMVDKSFYLLDGTYEEHKEELSEFKRKNYEKYQEKYLKNDKQLHKQLHNDVECLVLDGTR